MPSVPSVVLLPHNRSHAPFALSSGLHVEARIGSPELASKRPKTELSTPKRGSEKGTKEFFNGLGPFGS